MRPIIEDLRLGSALDEIPLGSRIDMGSMISEKAVQRAEKMLQEAQEEGASILCGGARYQHPKFPDGHYFQPTLSVSKRCSLCYLKLLMMGAPEC